MKRKRAINQLISVMLLTCIVPGVFAQHQHQATHSASPATLNPGAGKLNFAVTTRNIEARKFFNQGLALIYGFNHEEAKRSFERASQLDPQMAMAYWGVALAVGPNYNESEVDQSRLAAADAALKKATELSASASKRERDYIDALSKRFQLNADLKKCAVEYKDAMSGVYKKYPGDVDAATLYADSMMNLTPWQLWSKDGKPGEFTAEIVSILESVLKRAPDHIGANHLYIHAVEASKSPGRALASAGKLGKLAPASGHLVHMPGHIYIRTGNYSGAAAVNEDAARVDKEFIKRTGATGMYPAMYYSHNLHFLVESYNRLGNYALASRSAKRLGDNVNEHLKDMPMLESFLPSVMGVPLRFSRWDEVLNIPDPGRDKPIAVTLWHYARGVALAGQGKVDEAQAERGLFAELSNNIPGETPFGLNKAAAIMKIAASALDARIAAAKGDRAASIKYWREAVEFQDALNYDEPPGWYYPVRESLGAALLLDGQAAEAEKVFRKDLEQNPNSGRSLFGLAESLKKQGKRKEYRAVQLRLKTAWKNADTKLRVEEY